MLADVNWLEAHYGAEIDAALEQVRNEQAARNFVYWPNNGGGCITAAEDWWL